MKKMISVLLALVLLALPMAAVAAAADDDTPDRVCCITPPGESYMFTLEPMRPAPLRVLRMIPSCRPPLRPTRTACIPSTA